MKTMTMPKSVWEGVSIESDEAKAVAKSWFCGLADDMEGPLKANILTRTSDDKTLKIRALFKNSDGAERELVRTTGAKFSVSIKPPTKQPWA